MWVLIDDSEFRAEGFHSNAGEWYWLPGKGRPVIDGQCKFHDIPWMKVENMVEQFVTQPRFGKGCLENPVGD
jgi:hypothetical protein